MNGSVIQSMIEQALLQVHTGFFGKVISVNGQLATVQPLNMVKTVGGQAVQQAVIESCPVMQNVKKVVKKQISTSVSGEDAHSHQAEIWDLQDIAPGDIVYCVCADRDISETRLGTVAAPVAGHHMLSSAVVVGVV